MIKQKATDRFGNKIYPETQFGGGVDSGRGYNLPGEVGGGYFRSYGEIAEKLGYDPEVFAASGGFVGRRGPYADASGRMMQARSEKSTPVKAASADPAKTVMDRIVMGLEESSQAQKNLLARYKPATFRERSFFA